MKTFCLSFFFLTLLTGLNACDTGSTGQEMVEYDITGAGGHPSVFTDSRGWEITLDKAELVFGPLVFCSHFPTFITKSDSLTDCGKAMGEFSQATHWDLMDAGDSPLGRVTGFSGQVHSVQYDFGWHWPANVANPLWRAENSGFSMELAGTATKGNTHLDFTFQVNVQPKSAALYTVAGLGAKTEQSRTTRRVMLTTSVERILRYVNFDLYEDSTETILSPPDSALHNQLVMGLVTGNMVTFTWESR